jgi:hypothetical protein
VLQKVLFNFSKTKYSTENPKIRKAAKLHGVPKSTLSRRKASGNDCFHGSGWTTQLSKATAAP